MRTVQHDASVRLYHLDEEGGAATTLFYGPLDEALARAATEPEAAWPALYLQTRDDVVGYLDLVGDADWHHPG